MESIVQADVAWFRHMARLCLSEARRIRTTSPRSADIALRMAAEYRLRSVEWPIEAAKCSTAPPEPWRAPAIERPALPPEPVQHSLF